MAVSCQLQETALIRTVSLREMETTIGWTSTPDGQIQDVSIICVGENFMKSGLLRRIERLRYKHLLTDGAGVVVSCVGCNEQPGCATGQLVGWPLSTRCSSGLTSFFNLYEPCVLYIGRV